MTGIVRVLLGFAILCAALGIGATALGIQGDFSSLPSQVAAQTTASLGQGKWLLVTKVTGLVFLVAVASSVLEQALRTTTALKPVTFEQLQTGNVREAVEEVERRVKQCVDAQTPDLVAVFDELLRGAVKVGASDIHISPSPQGVRLTYRVQGTLHIVADLDLVFAPPLATRIKVLARLDTHIRGTPQDGRLVVAVDDRNVEARVSTLPTETGERLVLRIIAGSQGVADLGALGFRAETERKLKEALGRAQGLIFVTGPVGSGKTTTLYSALRHIADSRGRTTTLVTLEDPIELELPFATQTQMNARTGMTFAGTLRSVLRQDPNVLMVGEIRDKETAEIAAQAGLTGHLILTTVHAESAVGPFARLMEMSVEPYVLASGTLACMSQRLVRMLCTHCRRAHPPEPRFAEFFHNHGIELPEQTYYVPVGCDFCEGEGFTGRAPIVELLLVNDAIREAINARTPSRTLYEMAVAQGMTPLLVDGLGRARRGETSLAEVVRVAG